MKEHRVLFRKGEQKKFLELVVSRLNCVSLRGILQFGFDVNYNSIKNYYSERRLIPKNLFMDMCHLAKIDFREINSKFQIGNNYLVYFPKLTKTINKTQGFGDVDKLKIKYINGNWGQVKGGKRKG